MDHAPSIARDSVYSEFNQKLAECTVKPDWDGGREFVQIKKFTDWMRSKTPGGKITQTQRLVTAVYPRDRFEPISATKILEAGDDCCVLVFSILIEIDLGYTIHEVQQSLVDHHMPVPLDELRDVFRQISPDREADKHADQFNNKQWKFTPMRFRWDMNKTLPEEHIIPICRKRMIGQGGQSHVYSIIVPEEFVCQQLHSRLSKDEHTRMMDDDFGQCFQLALKSFDEGNFSSYNEEKAAFDGMKNKQGIIQYLGTYGHEEPRIKRSANNATIERKVLTGHIILEYGEFSLMRVFQDHLIPCFDFEIKNFWSSLIEIVDGLKGIHKFKTANGEWRGWHNDIKPENVIVVDGNYKLAVSGFAKIKRVSEREVNPIPTIVADGGTRTYAAPEAYTRRRGSKAPVTQSVDIWSVGCVLSMAATWLVLSYQGIESFRVVRRNAIEALVQTRNDSSSSTHDDVGKGDFFHNGKELLADVKQWHKLLRQAVRQADRITAPLLDFVEEHMLVAADKRLPADELYVRLQEIVDVQRVDLPDEMNRIIKILLEKDETASSIPERYHGLFGKEETAIDHTADGPLPRGARPELLKTASRYEALSRVYGGGTSTRIPDIAHEKSITERLLAYTVEHQAIDTPEALSQRQSVHRESSSSSIQRRPTIGTPRTSGSTGNTPHKPQNVIQAAEQSVNPNWRNKLRRGDPDDVLSRYFGNRDIKFLVDNASSMADMWDEATFLLDTLVKKAAPFDKDGMDLYFTLGQESVRRKRESKDFRKAMAKARPQSSSLAPTDMISALERVFKEYFHTVDERRKRKRNMKEELTLIIITDGIWAATDDKEEVGEFIVKVLKRLQHLGIHGFKERPVSIEFVQLGNDADATERLRALDDDMPLKGYKDIIDHEIFSVQGDVRKMLLGSFVPAIDRSKILPIQSSTLMMPLTGTISNRNAFFGGSTLSSPTGSGVYHNIAAIAEEPSKPTRAHARASSNGTRSSIYDTPPDTPSKSWRRSGW